jgi:HAD-hyrolase-like
VRHRARSRRSSGSPPQAIVQCCSQATRRQWRGLEWSGSDSRALPGRPGAFGCDAESRAELIDLARARAGGWPPEATVEIGDTARDASSAREAGIRSILVGDSGLAAAVAQLLA